MVRKQLQTQQQQHQQTRQRNLRIPASIPTAVINRDRMFDVKEILDLPNGFPIQAIPKEFMESKSKFMTTSTSPNNDAPDMMADQENGDVDFEIDPGSGQSAADYKVANYTNLRSGDNGFGHSDNDIWDSKDKLNQVISINCEPITHQTITVNEAVAATPTPAIILCAPSHWRQAMDDKYSNLLDRQTVLCSNYNYIKMNHSIDCILLH